MTLWDTVGALEIEVAGCTLERLEQVVATRAFTRATTVVRLHGQGHTGAGEDVCLAVADHDALPAAGELERALAGREPLARWCERLATAPLWQRPPAVPVSERYRRWAFESAALELAVRQNGTSLAALAGRAPQPVRFVASFRLGEPPSLAPVRARLDRYPRLRLKLDPTAEWSEELTAQVAATGAVDVVDLKGHYRGSMVDQAPDPALYARVLAAFDQAWVEDPAFTPATAPLLAPHAARIAWDAPVLRAADLAQLPAPAAAINVKPSRIGSIAGLLELYEHAQRHGIALYGGGQFELGHGRRQAQQLAALFHPTGPNDVAPAGYNAPLPTSGLPESPLTVEHFSTAFA